MTIYVRTAAGNEAALNASSPLPRKLRTLLIAIDGRTRVDTYVTSLSSFGDVDALLGSLQEAGLIEAAPSVRSGTYGAPGHQMAGRQNDVWSDTDASRPAFEETAAAPSGAFARLSQAFRRTDGLAAGPGPDELPSWARLQQPTGSSVTRQSTPATYYVPSRAVSAANTADYQLRNAISLMSDFVTSYLPADSFEVVLALEGLGSVEQVLNSLKGYEALVAPVGEPARRHLGELRAALARA